MTEEQITSLTYEFENVAKKLDFLSHFTSGYAEFFHQRADCELAYALALQQQCGAPIKTKHLISRKDIPLDRVEETMKGALQTLNEETLKIAQKHMEMGTIFLEQIAKPLDALQRNIELSKRRVINEFVTMDKKHKTMIKTVEKNKEMYKKLVNDLRSLSQQLETNTNPRLIDGLVSRKQATLSKIQQVESAYKDSVEKANAYGSEIYGEPIKKIIATAVELIKTQFETMKNSLNIVSAQLSELMPVQESSISKMKDEIAKVDFEKDFIEFVNSTANVHKAFVVEAELEDIAVASGEKKEEVAEEPKQEEGEAASDLN